MTATTRDQNVQSFTRNKHLPSTYDARRYTLPQRKRFRDETFYDDIFTSDLMNPDSLLTLHIMVIITVSQYYVYSVRIIDNTIERESESQ